MSYSQLDNISDATLKRLPQYYRELLDIKKEGKEFFSCPTLSEKTGFQSITVRKDLQKAGAIGKPKIGYSVNDILSLLSIVLGLNNDNKAVLVGAGNLGNAILGYRGFVNCSLNIVNAFDVDVKKINKEYYGKRVLPLSSLEETIKKINVKIGIITTPPKYAQGITDTMIDSGITGIWNFSPLKISVPESVIVENVDLSVSLSVLTTKLSGNASK